MSDRVRVATSHQRPQLLLLDVAARVTGKPRTTAVGEFAIRQAEYELADPQPDAADDDPRVAALLERVRKQHAKLRELVQQQAAADEQGDAVAARRIADDALKLAAALGGAATKPDEKDGDRVALEKLRKAVTRERADTRKRTLAERHPTHLSAGIALLSQLIAWTDAFDDLEQLGLDRGEAAAQRFPFGAPFVRPLQHHRRAGSAGGRHEACPSHI
jgi:hypothetical protein